MRSWCQSLLLLVLGVGLGALGYKLFDDNEKKPSQIAAASLRPKVSESDRGALAPVAVPEKGDDKESLREANRERAAGNYVLESHIPWLQERLAQRDRTVIDKIMAERGPLYQKMFSDFGMTSQQIAQTLHHITLIYQSKLDARKAMTVQSQAQMDFDIRMQQILGDRYKDYLAFESLSRAREESLLIHQFAQSSNLSAISGERAEALNSLIQGASSYTQNILGSLAGPRDEVARPSYGDAAIAAMEENQAVLSLGSASVIEGARQLGFTAQEIATLQAYFEKEVSEYDKRITQASNSVEGQIGVLERQLARLRSQNANAWAIAPYEEALASLRSKQKSAR